MINNNMVVVCIGPLSAARHCKSREEVQAAFDAMIGCFNVLLPALSVGAAQLIYDSTTDDQSLHSDAANMADQLNWIQPQQRKQWYLFTKNRARKASANLISVSASSENSKSSITGEISEDLLDPKKHWLSFGMTSVFDSDVVTIQPDQGASIEMLNSSTTTGCDKWFPRFEASPKHGGKEYVRASGDPVAVMDLDDQRAQLALLDSIEDGKNRYATVKGRFYRFVPTRPDSAPPLYHGFQVSEKEVPAEILKLLSPK